MDNGELEVLDVFVVGNHIRVDLSNGTYLTFTPNDLACLASRLRPHSREGLTSHVDPLQVN
jgi:hypothetical protein